LRAMAGAGLREAPRPWLDALAKVTAGDDVELARGAVAAARALRWPKQRPTELVTALRALGANEKGPLEVRLAALAALPDGVRHGAPQLAAFLRKHVLADQPTATRSLAAEVLSRARLSRADLLALAEAVRSVGPMEIDRVVEAFSRSAEEEVGRTL